MGRLMRDRIFDYAMKFVGTPYMWNGMTPVVSTHTDKDAGGVISVGGVDCSRFSVEIYQAFGLYPYGRNTTSRGLFKHFEKFQVSTPRRGGLVFYGTEKRINHVMLILDAQFCLGAAGGGRKTLTVADAIRDNAYVRQLPIRYRKDIVAYVDPIGK